MRITVVSLFPKALDCISNFGVTGKAIEDGLVAVEGINPRAYAVDKHGSVDDRPYGGGPGMLMRPEPLKSAIKEARRKIKGQPKVVCLSAQGVKFDHEKALEYAKLSELILVAGRYEGIDERLICQEIDEEVSIGDFVLSGGEIAALAVIDSVVRLIPGVLGHSRSAIEESFVEDLLEYPQYTRPECFGGEKVPSILLSGNHEEIRRWRLKQALGRTNSRRPDLIRRRDLSKEEYELLEEYIAESL